MSCFSSVMSSLFDQMQKMTSCVPPCTENIINYFAFCPSETSYRLSYNESSGKYQFAFEKKPSDLPYFFNESRINEELEFTFAKTKYYTDIACMYYLVNPYSKLTILYSHGNSCDLGDLVYLIAYLAKELNCNVLSYDYSGYGCSTGRPSEKQVYADVEAAALHLIQRYGLSFRDIILYGQSLGSAPTVDLASRTNVCGVVIQSGFTSAIGVPFPKMTQKAKRWDQFRNIDKIDRVNAPTLIIHGTDDRIVNFSHGVELFNKCNTAVEPLWIEGAGHVNIESYDGFIERLKSFLDVQLKPGYNYSSRKSYSRNVIEHHSSHHSTHSQRSHCRHS